MMRRFLVPALTVALLLLGVLQIQAQTTLFSDNFESYANSSLIENQGWWKVDYVNGNGPGNQRAYSNAWGIPQLPGSTQYSAGQAASDWDSDAVNLAYHAGGGSNLTGNFKVDWNFYDPLGTTGNPANFTDSLALSSATGVSGTAELASGSYTWVQRIQVGASSIYAGSWNKNVYQVRCLGYTDGYSGGNWFNTSVTRTVGWHSGEIIVGAAQADGTNLITISIDGTNVFQRNSKTAGGFNLLELNSAYTPSIGAFDNVSITTIPEPGSILALGMGLLGLAGFIRRRR